MQNIRRVFSRKHPSLNADYYYLNSNTDCETLIIEYGFADSKADDIEQLVSDWEKYAEGVVEALCLYFDVKYLAPSNIPEWKIDGLIKLTKKGLINNPDYWKDKLDDALPAWAVFSIISRI